jgi:hypothetical protein
MSAFGTKRTFGPADCSHAKCFERKGGTEVKSASSPPGFDSPTMPSKKTVRMGDEGKAAGLLHYGLFRHKLSSFPFASAWSPYKEVLKGNVPLTSWGPIKRKAPVKTNRGLLMADDFALALNDQFCRVILVRHSVAGL